MSSGRLGSRPKNGAGAKRIIIFGVGLILGSPSAVAQVRTEDSVPVRTHSCPWGLSGTLEGGCYSDGALNKYPGDDRDNPGSWRQVQLNSNQFSENTDSNTGKSKEKVCRGNPVDIATGNKIEDFIDFVSSSVEMPLSLVRKYRSQKVDLFTNTIFGREWQSGIDDRKLHFEGEYPELPECSPVPGEQQCSAADTSNRQDFALITSDVVIIFKRGSDGVFREQKPTPVAYATRSSDGSWTLNTEDNQILKFSPGGFLLERKTRTGVGWNYTYGGLNGTQLQRVTHSSGRYIEFTWADRVVTQVRDPAGNIYQYSYIGKTGYPPYVLKTVTLPGVPATTIKYHYQASDADIAVYGASGKLTGISYGDSRFSTYTYGSGAIPKMLSSSHGSVENYGFAYANVTGGVQVTETNPLGKQTNYLFDEKNRLVAVEGLASANCQASSKGADYDTNGNKSGETDFNDVLTTYQYQSSGRLQSMTEAAGTTVARTTTYEWDESKNQVMKEAVLGEIERSYLYDTLGRITKASIKNISAAVPASKDRVREITYIYENHPNNVLSKLTVQGPLPGPGTASVYNTFGDLVSRTNNAGHTITYGGHNGLGRPAYVVGPNGDRVDYVYDARGRVASTSSVVNGSTQVTTYVYDSFGRLAAVTTPDGVKHGYQYDVPGRLISEYESEGGGLFAQRVYTYNSLSLPTSVEVRRVSFEPVQGTVP